MGIKISELPQATYPLESDIFPIVQEGETKQINANLFNSQINHNIANEFSSTSTYQVGDYVFYQGDLYCCTEAVTTAGEWNANNWELVQLADKVGLGGESLPVGTEVDYDGTSVPTGWEEVNQTPVYSTEETVCGTWTDGKPLYRKTVTTYTTSEDSNYKYIVLLNNSNNIKIINSYGRIYEKNNNYIYNYGIPTEDFGYGQISSVYQNSNGNIYISLKKTKDLSLIQSINITLEYTKTTD